MTQVQDISSAELYALGGGDWFETGWGVLLGTGFTAGLVGSGGFLVFGGLAGLSLIFYPF